MDAAEGIVLDTGPLVAFLDAADEHHAWVAGDFSRLAGKVRVGEAVLTEALCATSRCSKGNGAISSASVAKAARASATTPAPKKSRCIFPSKFLVDGRDITRSDVMPHMNVPQLSHLQFLVLDCIGSSDISGRELRQDLAEHGERKSGPSFYQLMSRLEDAGFVKGKYHQKIVEGQIIKERFYTVTGSGERAYRETLSFYVRAERREGFA